MITGEHSVIRMAEPDDAYELRRMYDAERPLSAMLDRRREVVLPSVDELREGLARPEKGGVLYAVEDRTGDIRGFCALRGATAELRYGEIILPLFDDGDYQGPIGHEVLAYLCRLAFRDRRMNKILAHCLDCEAPLRGLLAGGGFHSNGVQRAVLWSLGRWFDIETLTLFHDGRQEV